MKIIFILLSTTLAIVCKAQTTSSKKEVDSLSAITIAEKNWKKKYGNLIYNSTPFYSQLKNDSTWVVKGTLHGTTGGTPYAEIRRKDGKVLFMIHMK